MPLVRLAMAQTNPVVGDVSGNLRAIIETIDESLESGANIVCFAEMALTGYPIEDLAQSKAFIKVNERAIESLGDHLAAEKYRNLAVVIGHVSSAPERLQSWAIAQNAATVLISGKTLGRYAKHHLPNYSVFDEYRNFVPGNDSLIFEHLGLNFSVLICEDIWQSGGPVAQLAKAETDVALVLNGSPFEQDKDDQRLKLVRRMASDQNCAVAYVNLVGGQDDLVFDGGSFFTDASGSVVARATQFEPDITFIDIEGKNQAVAVSAPASIRSDLDQIWSALVVGLRDYSDKNGFKGVVLGLSGGIDSAVCAALAVDALGSDRVFGVTMPSEFSSDHSLSDAQDLADRLEMHLRSEPIANLVAGFEDQLKLEGLSAENVQARVRGVILMGISNQEGLLVLSTGNKTEISVGYSTIYGDTVGGFAPIKDVPKTLVWELAKWRNEQTPATNSFVTATNPIPENSIEKPPSAELRPGQVDQDSLPPYDQLDQILARLIDDRQDIASVISGGFDAATVTRIAKLVKTAEWKRKQGAMGTKISPLAFGRDRRMPITNGYEG